MGGDKEALDNDGGKDDAEERKGEWEEQEEEQEGEETKKDSLKMFLHSAHSLPSHLWAQPVSAAVRPQNLHIISISLASAIHGLQSIPHSKGSY